MPKLSTQHAFVRLYKICVLRRSRVLPFIHRIPFLVCVCVKTGVAHLNFARLVRPFQESYSGWNRTVRDCVTACRHRTQMQSCCSEFNGFLACIVCSFHTSLHSLWQREPAAARYLRSIYLRHGLSATFSLSKLRPRSNLASCQTPNLHVLNVAVGFSNLPPTTWPRDAEARKTCAVKRDTSVQITVRCDSLA